MTERHSYSVDLPDEVIVRKLRSLAEVDVPKGLTGGVMEKLDLADRYFEMSTLAGDVYVAYSQKGISYIDLVERSPNFEAEYRKRFHRPVYLVDSPPERLHRRIASTLSGESRSLPAFDLESVTEFEKLVLLKALEIPYGQVRPYTWIAQEIGRPKAQRAVGSALARNPIPLLIPCHRVVRNDGIIGNYGLGGPMVKRQLLEAEGADPQELEGLARGGARYIGSDTTHIFCFPTCSHARRVTETHRHLFATTHEAVAAGYRGCKVCRPHVVPLSQDKPVDVPATLR